VPLTARQLNRATLARQLLLGRENLAPVEAVRRVVALQAQEPASPYIALWNRVDGFDPAALDAAFRRGEVVKAPLMRITLHVVAADDYPAFHEAMQPSLRAARLNDRRFKLTGLADADAHALVDPLRAFAGARPRTNLQMEARTGELLGDRAHPGAWWALRTYAPLLHAPVGGPWTFGLRPSYQPAPADPRPHPDAALAILLRRYLEGFGPASARDMARFALVHAARVQPALAALEAAGEVVRLDGPDGARLFDVPGGLQPPEDVAAPPRLLPMWDSVLLAYADRGRILPEAHRRAVTRTNGDVLPTLLVDGRVAGVWRAVEAGVEATAFRRLSADDWAGLAVEARALRGFLASREPTVYRRYAHWWRDLPGAEVRVIGDG